MPKYSFAHVHILSRDPVKTAEFYERTLGAKKDGVRKVSDGSINVDLTLNGTEIKIRQPRQQPLFPGTLLDESGLEHLGLRTDDIEAALIELKANGAKIVQDIKQTPTQRVAFFITPDNVLIELVEPNVSKKS